ncbi:MAG: PAS domain-containing protein [Anaerolineales bacterium]|nr:PAS domain-containing protein [Anaerolineales bacterium]
MAINLLLLMACLACLGGIASFRAKLLDARRSKTETETLNKQYRVQIEQMQALQQRLLDASHDGIVLVDEQQKVVATNTAAARFFKNQMIGETAVAAMRHHGIQNLMQQTAKNDENETLLETREGTCQVKLSKFATSQGHATLITLHDVTALNRAKRARHEMVSNISHELRHPITNIGLLTETLLDPSIRKSKRGRKMLETIQREIETLKQLVQEMQDLARIESGQMPIKLVPIPLSMPIENGTEPHRALAEAKEQHITIEVPDNVLVLADSLHIERVVRNLVHNAVKYTPEGGSIHIRATIEADEVLISISDTGFGIPEEERERIFERFYQVDKSRHDGTGLGLAIARHIVLAHGGKLWVESVENEGSTFFFTLPLSDKVNKA